MAISLSKESQIAIGSNLVGKLISWDYADTGVSVDTTDFGDTHVQHSGAGLVDTDFTCEAHFDLADTGQDILRARVADGVSTDVDIFPDGFTIGEVSLAGTILILSSNVTAGGIESVIMATFSGKIITELTESTLT